MLLPTVVLGVAAMHMLKKKRYDLHIWTLLVWSLGWCIMTFFIPRAIEYWILPTWLLAALLIQQEKFSWPKQYQEYKRIAKGCAIALVVLYLFASSIQGLTLVTQSATNTKQQDLQTIALFLKDHSPAQSKVYYPNWAMFPKLFAHNDHNRYLVGFDPVFQYEYSKEMYWLWHNISTEATLCSHEPPCEQIPTDQELTLLFTRTFRTPYLVLPTEYADAIRERIEKLPTARLLFETPTHVLYEIEEQVDP